MFYSADISNAYLSLSHDERIGVSHISIYVAFLYLWEQNNYISPIPITRQRVMELSHISSIVTYHKCIRQLQDYGYIQYQPSFNSFLGSSVSLLIPRNQ